MAGGVFGWGFAEVWCWPLQIAALAWLAFRLRLGSGARWRGAIDSAAFGLCMYGVGLWWVPYGLHREWPGKLLWFPILILAGVSLLRALVGPIHRLLLFRAPDGLTRAVLQPFTFATAWTGIEVFASAVLHLPMLSLGFGQIDAPYSGIAPLVGVHGVSFLAALAAWFLAEMIRWALLTRSSWPASGYAAALLFVTGIGMVGGFFRWTHPADAAVPVVALQDGLSRSSKYTQPGLNASIQRTAEWANEYPGALLVGAESQISSAMLPMAQAWFAQSGSAALIGVRLEDTERTGRMTNSVVGLGPGASGYRYDKRMLIPFGEYLPSGPLAHLVGRAMNYTQGTSLLRGGIHQPPMLFRGVSVVPTVCFENFFPQWAAQRLSSQTPNLLVNLADMAIFRGTPGMAQDVAVNRMLALELQTPLVRGSDDGPTLLLDSQGRVVAQTRGGGPDALAAEITPSVGKTPYAWWAGR